MGEIWLIILDPQKMAKRKKGHENKSSKDVTSPIIWLWGLDMVPEWGGDCLVSMCDVLSIFNCISLWECIGYGKRCTHTQPQDLSNHSITVQSYRTC